MLNLGSQVPPSFRNTAKKTCIICRLKNFSTHFWLSLFRLIVHRMAGNLIAWCCVDLNVLELGHSCVFNTRSVWEGLKSIKRTLQPVGFTCFSFGGETCNWFQPKCEMNWPANGFTTVQHYEQRAEEVACKLDTKIWWLEVSRTMADFSTENCKLKKTRTGRTILGCPRKLVNG